MAELEKQAKNKEKLQAKVDREKKKLTEIERERNAIEERLNSTKRLDELDEYESLLRRLNEEDQAIIDDVNASEFGKEAANKRMAAKNEELSWLQAQIAEREAAMPLRERIREIFKKYGVTVWNANLCLMFNYMRCILHYMWCLSYYMHCFSYYMRCFRHYTRYFCNHMQCCRLCMRCFRRCMWWICHYMK